MDRGPGLELYPAQTEALIELVSGSHVILSTPTGSGKSLVATGAHFAALAAGRRSVYTAPIKALVSEKFFALCDVFGADRVGMLTGDASVNATAPIICCTAEVLANQALREGADADVDVVIMDEFHYYGDVDRGWAWQVPLLELNRAQFLLMSATLGDVQRFADDLTRRTGREAAVVTSVDRPVPLHHWYETTPLHETISDLLGAGQAPIYVVHFTQAGALELAQSMTSLNVASRGQKDRIAEAIGEFRFAAGFGRTLSRLVRQGVGVHHAGMLPKYRRLVEQLAQAGLLKVICGTDTLGVGINVPIRTVLLTSLVQVRRHPDAAPAGARVPPGGGARRAAGLRHRRHGRGAGARARGRERPVGRQRRRRPEEAQAGAAQEAAAGSGVVDQGDARPTGRRRAGATGLALRVSHAMLLDVISRPGDAFAAMRRLLTDNHEPRARRRHVRTAIGAYRALRAAGVVEELAEPDAEGRTIRLTVDLPANFALNQPLSTFALAAIELLDPESETHALDVAVGDRVDARRSAAGPARAGVQGPRRGRGRMKSEGIDYDERMELLDEVSYPRPLAELLEAAYEMYRGGHPWVADHELSPKSVVRDMWERAMTFGEFVAFYGLARSEGACCATSPTPTGRCAPGCRATPAPSRSTTSWSGSARPCARSTPSLLDEWERLTHPGEERAGGRDRRAVPAADRQHPGVPGAGPQRDVPPGGAGRPARYAALGELDAESGWDADAWGAAVDAYFEEHAEHPTHADARGPGLFVVTEEPGRWVVRQIIDDPEGHHDWGIGATVDLAASDEAGSAVVTVTAVDRL